MGRWPRSAVVVLSVLALACALAWPAAAQHSKVPKPPKVGSTCSGDGWVTFGSTKYVCEVRDGRRQWVDAGYFDWAMQPARPGTPRMSGASKQSCINAWWDFEFAATIKQFKRTQSKALTDRIWQHCHESWSLYMTAKERTNAYLDFFQRLGDLVGDAIADYSAKNNVDACAAADAVMKAHVDLATGTFGFGKDSFLPILYKMWQGGPLIMKRAGTCMPQDPQLTLQLRRHYNGGHEGGYYPPKGTPDAYWILNEHQQQISSIKVAVCLVWSPRITSVGMGAGGKPMVFSHTYTEDMKLTHWLSTYVEAADCTLLAHIRAGLPVQWPASKSLDELKPVTAEWAGIWHMIAEDCSWRLQPVGGGPEVTWTKQDGPFVVVELREGDRFASKCPLRNNTFEHFFELPDGLFPIRNLSPGVRKPLTPKTCRYAIVDNLDALRNPPKASELKPYAGETFAAWVPPGDGIGTMMRSVGCGAWDLVHQ